MAAHRALRIVVHDLSGHPFQAELSREFARRGNEVLHLHCPSFVSGKGNLETNESDPPGLTIRAVPLRRPFAKYSLWKRPLSELEYGVRLRREIRGFRPDAVISSNGPLITQQFLINGARKERAAFVFWLQDVLSIGMASGAGVRSAAVASAGEYVLRALEKHLLIHSDEVVVISDAFLETLEGWGVPRDHCTVIENWAPLDEITVHEKDNVWSRVHGLAKTRNIVYSGTLGLKHNPSIISSLASRFAGEPDIRVVVVSEGPGAEWLRGEKSHRNLANLVLLPYQRYGDLPLVLASADVLLALLEPAAGVFSVPSKILSYHCAGRPIVASLPLENLGATVIRRAGSGFAVAPGDIDAVFHAMSTVLESRDAPRVMGQRARQYAESAFNVGQKCDEFERVLRSHISISSGKSSRAR